MFFILVSVVVPISVGCSSSTSHRDRRTGTDAGVGFETGVDETANGGAAGSLEPIAAR